MVSKFPAKPTKPNQPALTHWPRVPQVPDAFQSGVSHEDLFDQVETCPAGSSRPEAEPAIECWDAGKRVRKLLGFDATENLRR